MDDRIGGRVARVVSRTVLGGRRNRVDPAKTDMVTALASVRVVAAARPFVWAWLGMPEDHPRKEYHLVCRASGG